MKKLWSIALLPVAALLFGSTAAPLLAGCSASVCSADEENACTTTYTNCTTAAALAVDEAAGKKCGDDYCSCYDACGSTCDRSKLQQ
jgi:hypothetical protein